MQSIHAQQLCEGLGMLSGDPIINKVVTDNREATPGSLFVCIKGEHADGHEYAVAAINAGAKGVVAQHPIQGVAAQQCILVKDPLDAMIRMGGNYRAQYHPVMIGVTGSVGKTTTKEFCDAVFSSFGKTLKTQANHNNEIGVPKTLFCLDESYEYAIIEMGMQGLGEIEKLTDITKPDGAIITWVGQSHLEQLGTRENILKAKMEICHGMKSGAPLVINADNDLLRTAQIPDNVTAVTVGIENAQVDVRGTELTQSETGTHFSIVDKCYGKFSAFVPALGAHNVADALCAYALATRLGLNAQQAVDALTNYETTGHRQHIVLHEGVTVIEDCYNASPDSVEAALAMLKEYPVQGKRVAVLGDMFELGAISKKEHEKVGLLAHNAKIDLLITVGDLMCLAHEKAKQQGVTAMHFEEKTKAVQYLLKHINEKDAILVKASNGMAFKTILSDFYHTYRK